MIKKLNFEGFFHYFWQQLYFFLYLRHYFHQMCTWPLRGDSKKSKQVIVWWIIPLFEVIQILILQALTKWKYAFCDFSVMNSSNKRWCDRDNWVEINARSSGYKNDDPCETRSSELPECCSDFWRHWCLYHSPITPFTDSYKDPTEKKKRECSNITTRGHFMVDSVESSREVE